MDLADIRDRLDASVFAAYVKLVLRETEALIAALHSRRAFGHAIDGAELERLVAWRQNLVFHIGQTKKTAGCRLGPHGWGAM